MANDQNSNETIPKLLNIPLKDWAIIFGIVGGLFMYYINTAGENAKRNAQMDTILVKLAETQSLIKEMQSDHKTNYKDLEAKYNSLSVRLSILETQTGNGNKKQ